ncbi:RNA-binding region-containing protein 3 [Anopheles maculipalpis]|uniref:RNA-binding region-containing protein 3 n=1 Tax=Anopheles maculipalpis TaxID=1496333 RepID=UPI0021594A8D|nr:RNA-binding region-containing protein 3 [Anopheles maculipalpis]
MTSITLRIFNFPPMFTSVDVREFLHLFGLETVRFIKRRNTDGAIVSVDNESEARLVIARLHQLLIKTHRLKVEYTNEAEPSSPNCFDRKDATRNRNMTAPGERCFTLGFDSFPPPHLAYRYPKCSPEILENITTELASNTALYYQTLHLMNKMNLKPPFVDRQKIDPIASVSEGLEDRLATATDTLSDEESELESDAELSSVGKAKTTSGLLKRTMKVVNYQSTPPEPPQSALKAPKRAKLEIHISGASLTTSDESLLTSDSPQAPPEEVSSVLEECPTQISIANILSNRIPDDQRTTLNVFQNYSPGEPTNKLYIKNLSKQVTEQDLVAVFSAFFPDKLLRAIDVRLMKTGRMKGQAFVTFVAAEDSEELSDSGVFKACIEKALTTVNGYILKDKPIVVSYAKKS